jgi:hypothetical protein
MHAELIESLRLGLTVFLRDDAALREARLLVMRKRRLRTLEAESAALNIRSLQLAPSGRARLPSASTAVIFCALSATCGAFTRTSQGSPTPFSSAQPRLGIAMPI